MVLAPGAKGVFKGGANTLENIGSKFKAAFQNSDEAGNAAMIAAKNADNQMEFVTSFAGAMKNSGLAKNNDEVFATLRQMDDLDDGMKAVMGRAQVLMNKVDDAADTAGDASAGVKKADDAADASKGVKKAGDAADVQGFCLKQGNGSTCAIAVGATAYAGLWIEGVDRTNKRRRMCRGLCMPTNTDTFHNDSVDFATVGIDQIAFRPIDDPEVLKVFPDITDDTVDDHPICATNSTLGEKGIENLKDCEVLCDTRCDEAHPKYNLFNPAIDVAEKGIETGVEAAKLALKTVDDSLGFSDMVKKFWWVILILGLLAVAGVAIKFWPKSRQWPAQPFD